MTERAEAPRPLAWSTVLVLAIVGGIAVANVYYLQPLLQLIAEDFHRPQREAGLAASMMQVGYAFGILAFVPLGDILERRRMLVVMFVAVAALLAVAALAPTLELLALAILTTGFCTTCPQVLLPFAADLAAPRDRGRVVGAMATGLIVGTLYARAAAGFIGAHFGWRAVFVTGAVTMLLSSFALARVLPARAPNVVLRYRDVVASTIGFVGQYPLLRVSMVLGMLGFASFSGIWTVLAFHMHDLGYGSDVVGTVGLLSLFTAFAANWIGLLTDRFGTFVTGTLGWAILLLSFVIFLFGGWSLWGIMLAAFVFPFGTQLNQISNQVRIFALADDARSRLNTAYTFAMFGGGALGSLLAAAAWQAGNWNGVCLLELATIASMAPFLLWFRRLQRQPA